MKDFGEWLGELTQQLRGDSAPAEQAPVAPPAPPLPLVGGHTHTMGTGGYGDAGGHTHMPVPLPQPQPQPLDLHWTLLQGGPRDGMRHPLEHGQRIVQIRLKTGQIARYELQVRQHCDVFVFTRME